MTVLEYEGEKLDQAQLEGVQAMVDDLKRQYASLKVAMQDVCDKDGNLKTDSEGTFLRRITSRLYPTRHIGTAKLWDLLAPVDHQHNPVTYDAVAHSNGVWRVMAAVVATFPPISVAPVDNDLDRLRDKWARKLDLLATLVGSQLQCDLQSVRTSYTARIDSRLTCTVGPRWHTSTPLALAEISTPWFRASHRAR